MSDTEEDRKKWSKILVYFIQECNKEENTLEGVIDKIARNYTITKK